MHAILNVFGNTGVALREYVWLGSTPIAVFTPDPASSANPPLVYYFHTDHLDTPRAVIDKNNALRWRWLAEPFGTTAPETNPSGLGVFTQNLRFPGQYADSESGLSYNVNRDYDASIGRYVQSDPIGLQGGINTYTYVDSSPVNSVDPTGLVKLHGNWCGPNWTGGFSKPYDKLDAAERQAVLPPVTKLDSCCQTHDMVYAVCRKANPCDAKARQKCFEDADRALSSCAAGSGSSYGANLLLFGNPSNRISDYMRDSSPAAESNAAECSCTK